MKFNHVLFRFLLILILFTFYSCEKNLDELQCETLENLVGTWNTDARVITFNENQEIIDSVFYDQYNESLAHVVKGSFKLTNGIMELSNLKFTYLKDMSGIKSFHYQFPTFRFQIIDNRLYLDEIGIFRPKEHGGTEISGKWQSNRIIVVYDTEQSPSFLTGNQIIEFDFKKETNNYMINYHNSYGIIDENISDGPFNYRFEPPYVYPNISNDAFGMIKNNILINFSNGERVFTKTN